MHTLTFPKSDDVIQDNKVAYPMQLDGNMNKRKGVLHITTYHTKIRST